ncbi:MAG: DMT family transporter, partial [Alphaproteobacteria bacterium]
MSRQSFPPIAYVLLIVLAAIWGSSFLLIKLAVVAIPPMTLVAARLVLAAAGMLAYLWATGRRLPSDGAIWRDFVVLAVAGNILPFALISWGEVVIDSGLAAILMAVMPLSSLVLAHVFTRDERLSPAKLAGVFVGFIGIVVLVGPGVLAGLGLEVLAQVAVAGAAVCYAISNVYTRVRGVVALPASVTSAGVLLCAAVLSVPLSLLVDQPWNLVPTTESLFALLVLALVCTSLAYLILFHLITTTGATFVAFINYLVPVFGIAWGAIFLHETVHPSALAGLALILAGIAISRFRSRRRG